MKVKSFSLILCNPVDCSLPGSSVHGIFQARVLEWGAIVFPCIFSILISRLFICNSILFSRFWIIFTIIIWNYLSGRFPIFSSFVLFGVHLFCLFLYLLGIPLSLHLVYIAEFGVAFLYSGSLWSSLYCGISSLWVGFYQCLVKVSWLGRLMSVFWVELDFFSLE